MEYTQQMGNDFFFNVDNATNPPWPMHVENGQVKTYSGCPTDPPEPFVKCDDVQTEVNVIFPLSQEFYRDSLDEFTAKAQNNAAALKHIFGLMKVEESLGGKEDLQENLMLAFQDFGQGVLWDERRNVEEYGWWPLHSMDAAYEDELNEFGITPPNPPGFLPPNGYYFWYGAARGMSLVVDPSDQDTWLWFGRALAVAAAVQNIAKPKRILGPGQFQGGTNPPPLGPWTNPNNPGLTPEQLASIRGDYGNLPFPELDEKFKTTDGGKLGPQPF